MKKNKFKFHIIFALTVVFAILIDQITKILTTNKFVKVLGDFLQISYTQNTGVAFSFLSGKGWLFIPISMACVVVLAFLFFLNRKKTLLFTLATSLIIGGAVGNLIDRICLSYVRDFIYFNFFPAIFNFADAFVTIGTILLLIYLIFFFGKEGKHEKNI